MAQKSLRTPENTVMLETTFTKTINPGPNVVAHRLQAEAGDLCEYEASLV